MEPHPVTRQGVSPSDPRLLKKLEWAQLYIIRLDINLGVDYWDDTDDIQHGK